MSNGRLGAEISSAAGQEVRAAQRELGGARLLLALQPEAGAVVVGRGEVPHCVADRNLLHSFTPYVRRPWSLCRPDSPPRAARRARTAGPSPAAETLLLGRQAQDLPGFGHGGHRPVELGGQPLHLLDELVVVLGEHALAQVDVVFHAHPHVAAHVDGHGRDEVGRGAAAERRPGGAFGQRVDQVDQVPRVAFHAAVHVHAALEVDGGLEEAVFQETLGVPHHAGVEDFDFGLDAVLDVGRAQLLEEERRVEEDALVEVHGAGVEGAHVGLEHRCGAGCAPRR